MADREEWACGQKKWCDKNSGVSCCGDGRLTGASGFASTVGFIKPVIQSQGSKHFWTNFLLPDFRSSWPFPSLLFLLFLL